MNHQLHHEVRRDRFTIPALAAALALTMATLCGVSADAATADQRQATDNETLGTSTAAASQAVPAEISEDVWSWLFIAWAVTHQVHSEPERAELLQELATLERRIRSDARQWQHLQVRGAMLREQLK